MARAATKQQRSSVPATQEVALKPTSVTEDNRTVTEQQEPPLPPIQQVDLKRPSINEDDVRLRAYEVYLRRGDSPGDDISDWLQAERELMAD
ncbi:MAG: DUF2934 domain-containing protein [Terriglobia bacterium]